MVDGLSAGVSYASAGENDDGSTAFGATYAGVEGLSVSFGKGNNQATAATDIDQTVMKASYAYGSFTIGASNSDYDHTTATIDQEVSSFSLAYTVSDSISVKYGEETIEKAGTTSDIRKTFSFLHFRWNDCSSYFNFIFDC